MTAAISSLAPTLSLARFVEETRTSAPSGRATRVQRLPDGRTVIVFRVTDDGRHSDVHVQGPFTRAHFKNATGIARVVAVQLKPGWAASLLGVSAHQLTDRYATLEDVVGRASSRDLDPDFVATASVPELLDRLGRALAKRTGSAVEPSSGHLARRAVQLLEAGETRMENVAQQLDVTARHLRRVFTEHVGIGPKEFARTVRLQRAVRGAALSSDWARIATEAGYYDQAHLIADFRQLVGLTPGAYAKLAIARAA